MVADALSRKPLTNAIPCIENPLMDEIKRHYTIDGFLKFLFERLPKEARTVEKIDNF